MDDDRRLWAIKELLLDYVRSPSIRHIRDPYSVTKLAQSILTRLDGGNSIWRKWGSQRDLILRSALCCWIPLSDLRDFLNEMPGPSLTATDVSQRMRSLDEEEPYAFPRDELQAGCLELYQRERDAGTELPAIIGAISAYILEQEERIRRDRDARIQQWKADDRRKRQLRLQSGADSGWVQPAGSLPWFCRKNGRGYRLTPAKDKKWILHRVVNLSEEEPGVHIGIYLKRGDASKVVAKAAYLADLI